MQAPFDAVTACVPAGAAEDEAEPTPRPTTRIAVVAAPLEGPCVAKLVGPVAAPAPPVDDEEVQAPVIDAVVNTVRTSAAVAAGRCHPFHIRSSALSPGGSVI